MNPIILIAFLVIIGVIAKLFANKSDRRFETKKTEARGRDVLEGTLHLNIPQPDGSVPNDAEYGPCQMHLRAKKLLWLFLSAACIGIWIFVINQAAGDMKQIILCGLICLFGAAASFIQMFRTLTFYETGLVYKTCLHTVRHNYNDVVNFQIILFNGRPSYSFTFKDQKKLNCSDVDFYNMGQAIEYYQNNMHGSEQDTMAQ